MSEEMAKHAVKVLSSNFKRNFPAKGITDVWPELVKQPDAAIEKAVDHICLNCTYLPAPAAFLQAVKDEARKIATEESKRREREWAEQKGGSDRRELERSGSIFTTEQSDAHARHALQAIRLMLSPADRKDKLECFRVMDQQYPGAGWALQGMKLQKELERNDKRPHWRDISEASPQFQMKHGVFSDT